MTLYIQALNENVKSMIQKQIQNHRWTDSGFDIPMISQVVDSNKLVNCFSLGISVSAISLQDEPYPCLLLPRSSIYKSPFRLCNSIGLIDAGYRGEVKAMVDNMEQQHDESYWRIEEGTRLFQICRHDFLPWSKIVIVDELPKSHDSRMSGGFGSTGLQFENHSQT